MLPFCFGLNYSLGPGAVHIPAINPTTIAIMNTKPIGSLGINEGFDYSVAPVLSTNITSPPGSSSEVSDKAIAQLFIKDLILP